MAAREPRARKSRPYCAAVVDELRAPRPDRRLRCVAPVVLDCGEGETAGVDLLRHGEAPHPDHGGAAFERLEEDSGFQNGGLEGRFLRAVARHQRGVEHEDGVGGGGQSVSLHIVEVGEVVRIGAEQVRRERDGWAIYRDVIDTNLIHEARHHIDWLQELHLRVRPDALGHTLMKNVRFG
jgi:hypothetical protein